jgi:hypothetical protein
MAGAYSVEDVLPRLAAIIGQATGAEQAEVWIRTGAIEQLAAAWPAQALSAPPPGEPAAAPAPGPLAAPLPVTQALRSSRMTRARQPGGHGCRPYWAGRRAIIKGFLAISATGGREHDPGPRSNYMGVMPMASGVWQ